MGDALWVRPLVIHRPAVLVEAVEAHRVELGQVSGERLGEDGIDVVGMPPDEVVPGTPPHMNPMNWALLKRASEGSLHQG